ncbi:uncharacterized protein LOC104687695 isoform X4 [Corvus cornix cornix]|uniref:uncharacterized protein LOC104687695 isoform X4 n=1 Tax=Corvus cornix cornix TaxID=932674 RepID=UPI001952168D|nr:uncharacterized protein LOC104687695 isoform X4 [Corvus cornix cornix]
MTMSTPLSPQMCAPATATATGAEQSARGAPNPAHSPTRGQPVAQHPEVPGGRPALASRIGVQDGVSPGSVMQSRARDTPSVPHPEAPVLLPLTEPGRTQSRSPVPSPEQPLGGPGAMPAGSRQGDARRGVTPGGSAAPRPSRADTKALTTRSPPFPVPLPLFLPEVWAEPMAAAAAPRRSPVQRQLLGVDAQAVFELQQPQKKVAVAVGEMLTLNCTTSGFAAPGPVRWLKGLGSGNKTVYDQRGGSLPNVTRALVGSDTDFTIHIRNFEPNDVGTYYCVKFTKESNGKEEMFRHGNGTEVSVRVKSWIERAPTCPASRAARRRTTSTTPTCSPCPRPRGAAGARAQPPLSMPASG